MLINNILMNPLEITDSFLLVVTTQPEGKVCIHTDFSNANTSSMKKNK